MLLDTVAGVDHQQCGFRIGGAGDHVFNKFAMAGRVDDDVIAQFGAKPDLRGIDGDALVALRLEGIHQEGPFEGHAAALAHGLDGVELAVGERARVVEQAADQGGLAVIDMADDDDAQGLARRDHFRTHLHHMYPAARSRSKASSVSRSMARPARSGAVVASSSAMISSRVAALLTIGEVMSWSPSER